MRPSSFKSFSSEIEKISRTLGKLPVSRAHERVYKSLLEGSPVKVRITPEADMFGGGYFDTRKKEIGLSSQDFRVLAHEVGHAEIDQRLVGRMAQGSVARILGSPIGQALIGTGAGLLMAKGKKWGILLPAAAAAPTIASEYIATRKGGRRLDEVGATESQKKKYRRGMRRGLGTYLLAPALGTLVASTH